MDFEVTDFENGDDAYNSIYENSYDLLLLDIRVPGLSGYDLIKKVRDDGNDVPIILITSLTDINNLSIGYEMGCNDYIKKPFELKELKYRVLQILNQVHFSSSRDKLELSDGFYVNLKNRELYKKNQKIELTKIEKKLFLALLKRVNFYVPTETLINEVWENKEILESDLRMCIKRIRDKTDKNLIKNRRGLGYMIASSK